MSYTVSLAKRLLELRKLQADLPEILYQTAKAATQRAVEAAADATPPKEGTGRGPYIGANTVTSKLKQSWAADSRVEPVGGGFSGGKEYHTVLANNQEYASYVNNGHWMDRHFVPGLYLDPNSGLLSYDSDMAEDRSGGLMVGTKTKYVKGEFMVDKAKEAYEKAVLAELDKELGRLRK